MAFVLFNPNPEKTRVGDCVVRAICKATNENWETVYLGLALEGLKEHDMPSANIIWGRYLNKKGFKKKVITRDCLNCYTVQDFCLEHPDGVYVLGTGSHAICVVDGDIYDTWDSSSEIPIFYFVKEI